jgi:trehalose synthase
VHEVPVVPRSEASFAGLVEVAELEQYEERVVRARARLAGRTLWHVNSTAEGGGVAELLRSCLGYLRAGGIDTRWMVFQADPTYFRITKRIHNRLHGDLGDGGPLGPDEADHVASVTAENLTAILEHVEPGDAVVVHDPQPLGLVPGLAAHGATVIWTCHVGVDVANDVCRSAWDFLRPHLSGAAAATFTRRAYVWEGLDHLRTELLPPCIDAFTLKNIDLAPGQRDAILAAAGVAAPGLAGRPAYRRDDGAQARIEHTAHLIEDAPVPADAPLVVQVSRWDRLKDPRGVLEGFVHEAGVDEAHLLLAGPAPASVSDDPEADLVLEEMEEAWRALRPAERARVHLANLPTEDVEENAVIVNALQRRATIVVQKSLAEGFGLTVTEAMWKRRPVVAGRVGGIRDQVEDGVSGSLVDPRDLIAFGNAVRTLLVDPPAAFEMGEAAHERVRTRYLAPQYLGAYLALIDELMAG